MDQDAISNHLADAQSARSYGRGDVCSYRRKQAGNKGTVTGALIGGVLGAQLGARASARFRAEELRALLALVVLLVGLRMGLGLFIRPDDPFVLVAGVG